MGTLGRAIYVVGSWIRVAGQAVDRVGCSLQGSLLEEQVSRHRTLMNLFGKDPVVDKDAFVAPGASVIGDVQVGRGSSIWYGCVLRGDVNSISVGSGTNIQDNALVHVAKSNISGNVVPTIIGNNVTGSSRGVEHLLRCIRSNLYHGRFLTTLIETLHETSTWTSLMGKSFPGRPSGDGLFVDNVVKTVHTHTGHGAVLHGCTVEDEAFIGMGATLLDGAYVEKNAMVAAGALVRQNTRIPFGEVWGGNPAKFMRKLTEEEIAFISQSATNYTNLAMVHAAENNKGFEEIELEKALRKKFARKDEEYDSMIGVVRETPVELTLPDNILPDKVQKTAS